MQSPLGSSFHEALGVAEVVVVAFRLRFLAASVRKLWPVSSRMIEWCTSRSIAAAVVIGSLKILSHCEKTRLLVIITLRRS